jgi:hypothetical protein
MRSYREFVQEQHGSNFLEFLNAQPVAVQQLWEKVEGAWSDFLHALHHHTQSNMGKYDAHHAKFGNLMGEHPDQRLKQVCRGVEKKFEEVKEVLSHLGAHEMI